MTTRPMMTKMVMMMMMMMMTLTMTMTQTINLTAMFVTPAVRASFETHERESE